MRNYLTRAALAPVLCLAAVPALAAEWVIDQDESSVIFKYSYSGTPYQGEFKNVDAVFQIDPMDPGGCKFEVDIPIESIEVGDAETKDYLLDLELFDVDQFPTARFEADSCRITSLDTFEADGMLTIRDQTHPMTFPFDLDVETHEGQVRFHLTSEVSINRLEYGVGQGYWASTAAIPNEVDVVVDVYAVRQ